jgi:hypothetical protein
VSGDLRCLTLDVPYPSCVSCSPLPPLPSTYTKFYQLDSCLSSHKHCRSLAGCSQRQQGPAPVRCRGDNEPILLSPWGVMLCSLGNESAPRGGRSCFHVTKVSVPNGFFTAEAAGRYFSTWAERPSSLPQYDHLIGFNCNDLWVRF